MKILKYQPLWAIYESKKYTLNSALAFFRARFFAMMTSRYKLYDLVNLITLTSIN